MVKRQTQPRGRAAQRRGETRFAGRARVRLSRRRTLEGENVKTDPVVLKVVQRDALGRVRTLEILYDHETVDVRDPSNREFLIAHIERGVLKHVNANPPSKKPTGN